MGRRAARAAASLLLLLALAATARAQKWRDIGDPEGRFTFSMPGAPAVSTERYPEGAAGIRWTLETAVDEAYIAEVTALPPAAAASMTAAEILAASQKGSTARNVLLGERDIALGPFPGRAFEFRVENGLVGQVRVYWVRPRLYQLIAVASPAKAARPTAARFFDFRILTP